MSYIEPYNDQWPEWFRQEQQAITSQVTTEVTLHHIGSTAVPGFVAKPCIDVLAEVNDQNSAEAMIEPMQRLGYEYRGEYGIEGRYYFVKYTPKKFHVHTFVAGAEAIDKHLLYVDVMLSNPEMVRDFNDIKRQLSAQYPNDRQSYQKHKGHFYHDLFERYGKR